MNLQQRVLGVFGFYLWDESMVNLQGTIVFYCFANYSTALRVVRKVVQAFKDVNSFAAIFDN
jgi:hypothetical protein